MVQSKQMKSVAGVLGALFAVAASTMLLVTPASASTSITPNPISVSAGQTSATVTLTYSGLPTGKRLFVTQCRKDSADPTFVFVNDCSNLSELQKNPVDNPTGSGTFSFPVFRGAEPSGDVDWGCFATADAAGAIQKNTTCYLRITADTENNNIDAQSAAFTFTPQGAAVPEVPLAILLPLLAAGVLGAGMYVSRRRTTVAAS